MKVFGKPAVMRLLQGLAAPLVRTVMTYRFDPDFRGEVATIEKVYRAYQERIDSDVARRYLWRAVCQYKCQSHARRRIPSLLANVVAVVGLPFVLLAIRRSRKINSDAAPCKYLKIDFHMAYQVPKGIRGDTRESITSIRYLTFGDFCFAIGLFIKNRAFYPELLLKFLLWITIARPQIDSHRTAYLIQYCEYSATSSLRKIFLNRQGIRIANITHGEEFVSCRSAFSSFDQYFAWELTPKSIHDAMHIEYAERLSFNPCADLPPAPRAPTPPTFGFLWPSLEGTDLAVLVAKLNSISRSCAVIVRPHPNPKYANQFDRYRTQLNAQVSDSNREDIHGFIDRCGILGGNLSAALLQAAFRGREVIYLHDEYLASLREYHEYYRDVSVVTIETLDRYVANRISAKSSRP